MSELVFFILIAIGSVALSSVSQLMLKISANKTHLNHISEYLNPLVGGAYLLFFATTLITVYAYRVIPLSLGPIVEALGYVFIAIIGYTVLREKISRRKAMGMALIVLGVILSSVTL
jgi:drug/metabolite transporter (DMT)-like permease